MFSELQFPFKKSRCEFVCLWTVDIVDDGFMPRLFTDVGMEQKDVQEEAKKTNEQETTPSLYHGILGEIKDDILAQSKSNIYLFP